MSNTNFPGSIDSPTDPTATNRLNNPSHSAQHGFENDAIVALETKVGITNSGDTTSIDYKINHLNASSVIGFIPIANGGTGQSTANNALNALLPNQAGNSGKSLITDSANTSWATVPTPKFGGTGADGALSISSGTTTVNLGNAALFILNYSSVSITGTANLAFSNPNTNGTIVIIKSQGNVTITTSSTHAIDLRLLGGAGGAQGSNSNGTAGSASSFYLDSATHFGGGGGSSSLGGVAITISRNFYPISASNFVNTHFKTVVCGSGGGGGQGGSSGGLGGIGGTGAGGLYLEVGGVYNFTTGVIDASGQAGTNGNALGNGGAGAGGGAGGMIVIIYNTLTAETGTYNMVGGAGGAGGSSGTTVSGGGGGACLVAAGDGRTGNSNTGFAGSNDTGTGGAGGAGGAGPNGGGGGAGGFKISILNTEF